MICSYSGWVIGCAMMLKDVVVDNGSHLSVMVGNPQATPVMLLASGACSSQDGPP